MYLWIYSLTIFNCASIRSTGFWPHPSIPGFNQERIINNTQLGGYVFTGHFEMIINAKSCKPTLLPADW